jgi:PAS domain-containing protein
MTEMDNNSLLFNDLVENSSQELLSVTGHSSSLIISQVAQIKTSLSSFEQFSDNFNTIQQSLSSIMKDIGVISKDATENSVTIQDVNQEMAGLVTEFKGINSLIKTINTISDQTNLLALNATIEAARAGEHGKGFAVVANEVKELSRTAKAASDQIQKALDGIGATISKLSEFLKDTQVRIDGSAQYVQKTTHSVDKISQENTFLQNEFANAKELFKGLGDNSGLLGKEVMQLSTIGSTYRYLSRLMRAKKIYTGHMDPVSRFEEAAKDLPERFKNRFTAKEEECRLADNDILISSTNCAGDITFANDKFYEVAQFEPGTLAGKPHNIIRHPDMPKAGFADLWKTIRAGDIWTGVVLNKGARGRVYWVRATVYACFESGQIIGYISVRSKPSDDEIARAIKVYRKIE